MSHNLLKGKRGIIFGALNDKSIAWKVGRKSSRRRCYYYSQTLLLQFEWETPRLGKKLNAEILPADATNVEDLEMVFTKSMEILGGK